MQKVNAIVAEASIAAGERRRQKPAMVGLADRRPPVKERKAKATRMARVGRPNISSVDNA